MASWFGARGPPGGDGRAERDPARVWPFRRRAEAGLGPGSRSFSPGGWGGGGGAALEASPRGAPQDPRGARARLGPDGLARAWPFRRRAEAGLGPGSGGFYPGGAAGPERGPGQAGLGSGPSGAGLRQDWGPAPEASLRGRRRTREGPGPGWALTVWPGPGPSGAGLRRGWGPALEASTRGAPRTREGPGQAGSGLGLPAAGSEGWLGPGAGGFSPGAPQDPRGARARLGPDGPARVWPFRRRAEGGLGPGSRSFSPEGGRGGGRGAAPEAYPGGAAGPERDPGQAGLGSGPSGRRAEGGLGPRRRGGGEDLGGGGGGPQRRRPQNPGVTPGFPLQVECKKAQPKEVMSPTGSARGRSRVMPYGMDAFMLGIGMLGYPGFQAATYASRSYTGIAPGYTYQFPEFRVERTPLPSAPVLPELTAIPLTAYGPMAAAAAAAAVVRGTGSTPSRTGGFLGTTSPGPMAELYGAANQDSGVSSYISAASPAPSTGFGHSLGGPLIATAFTNGYH
uniref:Musashi RNA binding protein 1 n=1 Tax=Sarcophilus harrisii TaxID=9305 RepID=A0A7N4P471_SARHA